MIVKRSSAFGNDVIYVNMRNARSVSVDDLGGRDMYVNVWQGNTLVTLAIPRHTAVALCADLMRHMPCSQDHEPEVTLDQCVSSVAHQHRPQCHQLVSELLYGPTYVPAE